jgi:hypothetical protein
VPPGCADAWMPNRNGRVVVLIGVGQYGPADG